MAFNASGIFAAFLENALANATAYDLSGTGVDTFYVALYDSANTTPDKTATQANTAYTAGTWVSGGGATGNSQCFSAGQWAQGGVALTSPAITNSAGVVKFTGANTASSSGATMSNIYGCLVYDNTLSPKYGICFNYFGGPQSVSNGTFTVVWNASNGIFAITV